MYGLLEMPIRYLLPSYGNGFGNIYVLSYNWVHIKYINHYRLGSQKKTGLSFNKINCSFK